MHDYYRLFLSPGLSHCFGGPGPYPDTTFDALRLWVEAGVAPEILPAKSIDTTPVIYRSLCPYPKKAVHEDAWLVTAEEDYISLERCRPPHTLCRTA